MTATLTKFRADDTTTAKTKIEALNIASGDVVLSWNHSGEVIICKIEVS
jgi:hypothetical protein